MIISSTDERNKKFSKLAMITPNKAIIKYLPKEFNFCLVNIPYKVIAPNIPAVIKKTRPIAALV